MPGVRRGYASAGGRNVHYRTCGSGPPVVLLHDSPRSSRLHIGTMEALADRFTVFAFDTPGYGNSMPLDRAEPTIVDFAEALRLVLEMMGLAQAPLYATHTSAKIALALAVRGGTMARLVLDGLALPEKLADASFVAAYMRPFVIDDSGAYLAAEWTRMRDMLRWFPWFAISNDTRLGMAAPTREWLADYCIDLLSAGPHYSDAYAAAMRWDPMADLKAVAVPTIVAARPDDVLLPFLDRVHLAANPLVRVERPDAGQDAWLAWLRKSLSGAPHAGPGAAGQFSPPAVRCANAGYVTLPHGQLHWRGIGTGEPVLVLGAPSPLQARAWANSLGEQVSVIVPDLPGFCDSDALAEPTADAMADALAALIVDLGSGAIPVIACALAAPLGAALAARHPDTVRRLVIDGAPPLDAAAARRFLGLYPPVELDMVGGAHLHRLWHILRDSELHWPWSSRDPAGNRTIAPAISGQVLHEALVGLLKSPATWGQACEAAVRACSPAHWAAVQVPTTVLTDCDPAHADAPRIAELIDGSSLLDRRDTVSLRARLVRNGKETARHG